MKKGVIGFAIVLGVALVFGSISMALAQQADPSGQSQPGPIQSQTMTQSQKTIAGAAASVLGNAASITTGSSYVTGSDPYARQFPIPGNPGFAYIPSYFGPATVDVNWQTMKTMVRYKLDWSTSDAMALMEDGKMKSRPKCLYGTMSDEPVGGLLRVAVNGDGAKEVQGLSLIGTNDVWAKNVETTTQEVLGQAIYDGLCMNADLLLVTGEGAAVVMKAFGWGAGINNSVSVVTGGVQPSGERYRGRDRCKRCGSRVSFQTLAPGPLLQKPCCRSPTTRRSRGAPTPTSTPTTTTEWEEIEGKGKG